METIAVYWESKVKIYSITQVTDLSMARLIFPFEAAEELGRTLADMENSLKRFELVTQDNIDSGYSQMSLFYDLSKQKEAETAMRKLAEAAHSKVTLSSLLELVYLHGPHFQDRFGIADIAFSALKNGNVEIIVAGCAGTSIYMAVPHKQAGPATQILRETFMIPAVN